MGQTCNAGRSRAILIDSVAPISLSISSTGKPLNPLVSDICPAKTTAAPRLSEPGSLHHSKCLQSPCAGLWTAPVRPAGCPAPLGLRPGLGRPAPLRRPPPPAAALPPLAPATTTTLR